MNLYAGLDIEGPPKRRAVRFISNNDLVDAGKHFYKTRRKGK